MARCRERGAEHENLTDRELKQQISRVDKIGRSIMSFTPDIGGVNA